MATDQKNQFNHNVGFCIGKNVVASVETLLASGATLDVALPKNSGNVAFVSAQASDGTLIFPGATTFSAKVFPEVEAANGDITPAYVRFTVGSGGLAAGVKLIALVVC